MANKNRLRTLGLLVLPAIIAALPSLSSAGPTIQEPSNCKPRTVVCPPPPPHKCPAPVKPVSLKNCFEFCFGGLFK